MIIATAGHIDHGKTTLVAALTGVDTDRLPEEKARGLTIDLGFAYHPVPDGSVLGFVDVPGHERFVHNMLAGVAGVDFALLVVAADDGPMPQTAEHLAILDLLGIDAGVVALTKTDRVDPARVDAVGREIEAMLAPTALAGSPVMPVSSVTGAGVGELRRLLEETARGHQSRRRSGRFRLAVDRCFTVAGAGLVVTGTVFAGTVAVGGRLVLAPRGIAVRVRAIHAQNRDSERGGTGQRLGLNLIGAGLHLDHVRRGDWLVDEAAYAPTRRLDVGLRLLAGEPRALRSRTPVHLHLGAADVMARVAVLDGDGITPGHRGTVQLVLEREIGALRGDRLILRDRSGRRTMGGGEVIDPFPPARGRARPERLAWLSAMARETPETALRALLEQAASPLDFERFALAWNLAGGDAEAVLADSGAVRTGPADAPVLVSRRQWSDLGAALAVRLDAWHREAPQSPGPGEEQLRRKAFRHIPPATFHDLVREVVGRGEVAVMGAHLRRPGHSPTMSDADAALWSRVSPLLGAGGLRPPRVGEIADDLGLEPAIVARFLTRAARLGLVHPVARNRFFPPDAVRGLAAIAEDLADENGAFDAAGYRDRSGIGRNLTIEVLEYFNKTGFTGRKGPGRIVRRPAAEVFGTVG
jgi:selenocysteine-specific elongation factor